MSESDNAENSVGVAVWPAGEEKLIVGAVRVASAVLAELQGPNVVDFDGLPLSRVNAEFL